MDKMKMETPDFTKINVEKIAEMFPNVMTEAQDEHGNLVRKIDFEKLKQELSSNIIDGDESYDFTWVGKKQAMIEANKPINKTLRPCREDSLNWENTENLYIEGDNLEVLKLLQESYLNKVKMIYIDPPYNTGNDSFIYPDDYTTNKDKYDEEVGAIDESGYRMFKNTETNGRFHSSWCSMMYPRLKLARNLLSEDGVIFISIDDNEVDNLRKICDEVFGEDNFINNIVVNMSNASGPKIQHAIMGLRYPKIKEYVLLYAKNKKFPDFKLLIPKYNKGKWDNEYNLIIPEMSKELKDYLFKEEDIDKCNSKIKNFTLMTLHEYGKKYGQNTDDLNWKQINAFRICASKPNTALLKKALMLDSESPIRYIFNPSGEKKLIKTDFSRETKTARIELVFADEKNEMFFGDHWGDIVTTGGIAQEGGVPFQNGKKPLKLLKRILNTVASSDGYIMDFFSGSSSTAHAVMQLNAEDGGKRKFIMVQLPEVCDEKSEAKKAGFDNICEIGKERIRRAGKKIVEETGRTDLDIGFRVFKLDESNMKEVYYKPDDYNQSMLEKMTSNIKEDRTPEDLLYACMLDWGLELSLPHSVEKIDGFDVHIVNDGDLIACFDEKISEDAIKQIADKKPLRVVFRDSSFANDAARVNVGEIFKLKSPNTTVKVI